MMKPLKPPLRPVVVCLWLAGLSACGSPRQDPPVPVREWETAARPVEADRPGSGPSQAPTTYPTFEAAWRAATAALQQGQVGMAEEALRAALQHRPGDFRTLQSLALLAAWQGRRGEAERYAFQLVQQRQYTLQELILLAAPDVPFDNPQLLDAAARASPSNPVPLLGRVPVWRRFGKDQQSLELLRRIVQARPDLTPAQVMLGELLADTGQWDAFVQWHAALPESVGDEPEVWYLRGRWAQQHGKLQQAARAYWEAVRRRPDLRAANYQLGLVLNQLQRQQEAQVFLDRAARLADLKETVHPMFFQGPQPDLLQRAGELCEALGRLWEAWAWYNVLAVFPGENVPRPRRQWAEAQRDRIRKALDQEHPPQVVAEAAPARKVDLSSWPAPEMVALPATGPARSTAAGKVPPIRLDDLAREAGLEFVFANSAELAGRPIQILESTGGGVAVLDYDADGWPDLYFTQCCPWPVDPGQREWRDRLFRNRGDGTFQDVTLAAGLGDTGYSQGVAAGDFNNDGFPDLLVANVGVNRLYQNNGDGTFRLVTVTENPPAQWTTSCMIADVNGDGWPDLFEVNYLAGEEPFRRVCREGERIVACGPSIFPGDVDRVWLNRGDGTWEEGTQRLGLDGLRGKGLGLVAFDRDGTGNLSIFVANDAVANFFLVPQKDVHGKVMRLVDQALLLGLASDRDGRNQACMGIALADLDGDGRDDLYVTNYYDDYNTVYRQMPGGFFADVTRDTGLYQPTLPMLGFGTQAVDLDLDGQLDLVVANGHVDDRRWEGKPWKMPPQAFYNTGGGTFVELPREKHGTWMQGEYLGRGMARVDWNRDGLEDVVVSNIGAPASLVTNRTEPHGHFLAVTPVGVQSPREPIGAWITVQAGDKTVTRQLYGGDGYQASNQRQVIIGLADSDTVDRLQVRWPSGLVQSWENIPGDQEIVVVEGRPQWFAKPKPAR